MQGAVRSCSNISEGQQLNNCLSALWIAYLIAEAPISVILNKCPVAKWLGWNVIVWGVLITCTAAVKNYAGLLALRIVLGIVDASLPPSLMLISSQYYRKDEQAIRFAYWFSAVGLGFILGGLISFGFQHVVNAALESWRKFSPSAQCSTVANSWVLVRHYVHRPRRHQLYHRCPVSRLPTGHSHESLVPERRREGSTSPAHCCERDGGSQLQVRTKATA